LDPRPRLAIGLGVVWLAASGLVPAGGEIHGTVETVAGALHTGTIAWPDGSRFWDETFDCGRPVAGITPAAEERGGFRFSLFGVRLFHDDDSGGGGGGFNIFTVPFGEIRSIEPLGHAEAAIELRNGETILGRAIGRDLGLRVRRVVVEGPSGPVEVPWHEVRRVRFAAGPARRRPSERLWGTATTRAGKFTGFVRWDRDESVLGDELDGQAEGRDWSVPFRDIAAIAPDGSKAARVTLRSGREIVLTGTNDVNEDFRGLKIRTPGDGAVTIGWAALVRLDLAPAPESPGYDRYDGGRALRGTARTVDGTARSGRIAWDRGESYTFETLDGEADGIDRAIPFGSIASIRPVPGGRSEVRLRDGRVLTLGGSNDVDERNRGIWVEAADASTLVSFDALVSLEVDGPPAPPPAAPRP